MNLIKIAPMILMVLALSTQARGDEHMKRVASIQAEPVTVIWDYPVTRILDKCSVMHMNLNCADFTLDQLEDWMFNEEYLASEESSHQVESWMLESDYLGAESQPVEDWMLEASYLDQSSDSSIESWMMDSGYLAQ
ncbi:MAG: hypothetical protein V2A67_11005 [Bacteroidota bacterium]